jgi:hypothetical protein
MSLESYFRNLRNASGAQEIVVMKDNARTSSSPRMMTRKGEPAAIIVVASTTKSQEQEEAKHHDDHCTVGPPNCRPLRRPSSFEDHRLTPSSSKLSSKNSVVLSPRPHQDAIFRGIMADILQQHQCELTDIDLERDVVRSSTFLAECLDEVEAILRMDSSNHITTTSCFAGQ